MYEGVICFLQGTADLHTAGTVGKSLDHAGQFGGGFEFGAEIADVIHEGGEVHFEHRLVRLMEDAGVDGLFVVPQRPHHCCTRADVLVRRVLDHCLRVNEESHLLFAFLLERSEVLVVLVADIGDHAYCRTDDALKLLHLPGLTDSRFEDRQNRSFDFRLSTFDSFQLPHAQRHADLRVIGLRRTDDGIVVFEQLVEPLFDNGLAVRTGDADDRTVEQLADVCRQRLQCRYGIALHERLYAFLTQFGDVSRSVVRRRMDGEEEGLLGFGT